MAAVTPLPDLLPAELVAAVRAEVLAPDAPWRDGGQTAAQNRRFKRNLEIDAKSDLRHRLSERIVAYLVEAATPQGFAFRYASEPASISPFLFSRTGVGGGYGDHVDNTIMSRGTARQLRADLSMTVFLSDPSTYDGGELVIDSDMGFAPSFKLPAGSAVLYATDAVHRVNPVTRGERLVAVTWIESLIANPITRRMNADLLEVLNLVSQDGACHPDLRRHLVTKLEKVRTGVVKYLQ